MRRRIAYATATLAAGLGIAACGKKQQTVQSAEFGAQKGATAKLERGQPIPSYNFSQIRQNLIELENAQAEGVQTTSLFFNLGQRDPVQVCPSIGAPIPTTDQLTNPSQPLRDNSQPLNNRGGNVVVGQMDPNGVYSGNSTGTYVMCVGANGKVYADYWEGFVQTIFGPASWNYSTHQVQLVGPPSFRFTK